MLGHIIDFWHDGIRNHNAMIAGGVFGFVVSAKIMRRPKVVETLLMGPGQRVTATWIRILSRHQIPNGLPRVCYGLRFARLV